MRKQIGNAVPPLLAERIARSIRRCVLEDIGQAAEPTDEHPHVLVDAHQDVDKLIGLKAPRPGREVPDNQLALFQETA